MMSIAIKILQGPFGRVALLDMDGPLVEHAHHHCHIIIKISGLDTFFNVRGKLHPLRHNTAVLINAWEPHAYASPKQATENSLLLALYIEPTWLASLEQKMHSSSHPQFFASSCVETSPVTQYLAQELASAMFYQEEISPLVLENQLFDLVLSIIDRHSLWRDSGLPANLHASTRRDPRIRKAMLLIQQSFMEDINLTTIAQQCGLSRSHLFALFKQDTNLTPFVYVQVLRMEQAIRYLSLEQASMADISLNLGFSAPGHFTRFFKDNLGITPSDYRNKVNVVQIEP
ncbi:MAG: helix-turn-helix transcriptional regulator [Neisseriaceae bacterium]|nr:helix-turn-helix transcriptional regulator [Neisseriaceae bacterium]